jgi:ABC-type branched-subunit amino acid transport system ATPase component
MTVRQNVALGCESAFAGAAVGRQMVCSRSEGRRIRERTDLALDVCQIEKLSNTPVGALPTGQRRLVEVARSLAGDFEFLLLDEPSAGLSRDETIQFAAIVRRVSQQWGWGVIVVEHDMPLVMGLCESIFVLNFGRLIFEGSPEELRQSAEVREAYLGDLELEVRSEPGSA